DLLEIVSHIPGFGLEACKTPAFSQQQVNFIFVTQAKVCPLLMQNL
ncbi:hypothetical protein A2U01_0112188, partial [Trifolium medium]|nr:hypothetical protein [Trifolium medium]